MTADGTGSLYIIDTNGEAIVSYDTNSHDVAVWVSGSSSLPNAYVDGTGATTTIGRPRGIVSDGTSLYFAEQIYATIRQVELSTRSTTAFVGTMGCAASGASTATAARDGLGANTTAVFWQNNRCSNPPSSPLTPIFNTMFGAMNFNYATRSIFVIDQDRLRRIE
jgi:hypothetical protein